MNSQIFYLLVGGLVGYGGSIIQNILELNRQKRSTIRQEKLKIYSQVVSELGSLFIDKDTLQQDILNKEHSLKFRLKLGKILAPARLIASDKLEEMLRDLFEKETEWHDYLCKNSNSENEERLGDIATKARIEVEKEMRNELR